MHDETRRILEALIVRESANAQYYEDMAHKVRGTAILAELTTMGRIKREHVGRLHQLLEAMGRSDPIVRLL